jgi:hypothetical protein
MMREFSDLTELYPTKLYISCFELFMPRMTYGGVSWWDGVAGDESGREEGVRSPVVASASSPQIAGQGSWSFMHGAYAAF